MEQDTMKSSCEQSALSWEQMRRDWKSNKPIASSASLSSPSSSPISLASLDADSLYEQLIASEKEGAPPTSFKQPIPLPELIAVLLEVWEADGVMF